MIIYNFLFSNNKESPTDEYYYEHSTQGGKLNAFRGLSFELVCLQHIPQIKMALGISGVVTNECSWICQPNDELGIEGHQIDLLIDRNDGMINICEMKYSQNPYVVDKKEDEGYRQRFSDFFNVTKTKKSLILTLISPYGLKTNLYSGNIIEVITLDDLMK